MQNTNAKKDWLLKIVWFHTLEKCNYFGPYRVDFDTPKNMNQNQCSLQKTNDPFPLWRPSTGRYTHYYSEIDQNNVYSQRKWEHNQGTFLILTSHYLLLAVWFARSRAYPWIPWLRYCCLSRHMRPVNPRPSLIWSKLNSPTRHDQPSTVSCPHRVSTWPSVLSPPSTRSV